YGNVLDNSGPNPSALLVHFGGDSGNTAIYRKTLNFYDNTVVVRTDQKVQYRTTLFQLNTDAQVVDARNNIFYVVPATAGANPTLFELAYDAGTLDFPTANWISGGWAMSHAQELGQGFGGSIGGTGNFFVDPNNDPGFVSLDLKDYHLAAGSSAIDTGAPPVDRQYVAPTSDQPGPVNGSAPDLGAFESGGSAGDTTTSAGGATDVVLGVQSTATFSEPVQAAPTAFVFTNAGAVIPSTTSYNSTPLMAILTPSAALAAGTAYTATASGGKGHRRQRAGHAAVLVVHHPGQRPHPAGGHRPGGHLGAALVVRPLRLQKSRPSSSRIPPGGSSQQSFVSTPVRSPPP
ncbi:MAG: putative polysaccharide-degrading enzyme, partial [Planctomycetota bacterium]|nr:putative polysaccharide-degrading enzyme [Planctomycetota bacterium]